jgi:hypothetical protein
MIRQRGQACAHLTHTEHQTTLQELLGSTSWAWVVLGGLSGGVRIVTEVRISFNFLEIIQILRISSKFL